MLIITETYSPDDSLNFALCTTSRNKLPACFTKTRIVSALLLPNVRLISNITHYPSLIEGKTMYSSGLL